MAWKLIDLSLEIYQGMSLFPMHQPTFIMTNMSHDENKVKTKSKTLGFSARNLLISEHCGTHADAVWEYEPSGPTIDKMPLEYFWGSALCLDLSHVNTDCFITPKDLEAALKRSNQDVEKGDIVLLYTAHYDRSFNTDKWQTDYTGLNKDAAEWLAKKGAVNIGVDAPSIDHPNDLDFSGHYICGRYNITNTENLCNLDKLVNKRFLFFGLPLKIRDGSGSPIRAVALIEE